METISIDRKLTHEEAVELAARHGIGSVVMVEHHEDLNDPGNCKTRITGCAATGAGTGWEIGEFVF